MSRLSSLSIRRPVLASVMSIAIVIFGILGYTQLGVREYPSVDPAIITVSTSYAGANADVIESQITEPLEASVNSVEGGQNVDLHLPRGAEHGYGRVRPGGGSGARCERCARPRFPARSVSFP